MEFQTLRSSEVGGVLPDVSSRERKRHENGTLATVHGVVFTVWIEEPGTPAQPHAPQTITPYQPSPR